MHLVSGQQIIANGYFNCFCLVWWVDHTDVGSIGRRCSSNGRLALRLIGHRRDGERVTLVDDLVPEDHPQSREPHWAWDRG